jgi:hypothetical protein
MMAPDAVFGFKADGGGADAATILYFFKNAQFACWDVAQDRILPGYPAQIADHWPGLLDVFPGTHLRAALQIPEWGRKIFFLFEGQGDALVWDMGGGRLLNERVTERELLPCPFPRSQVIPVYARLPNGDGVIYGFHGFDYVRWTVASGKLDKPDPGFPRKIADDWKDGLVLSPRAGVYVDWPNRSSAHSNRKIYFFMGDLYLRWDVPSNSRNYRLDILAGWKGWPTFE